MKLCQIWTCCSWYKYKSKKKKLVAKNKKNYFAECQGLTLGKVNILPSANPRHSTKPIFCRVLNRRHSAKRTALGTVIPERLFAECPTLPSVWHWAKFGFVECLILPSARHSAKPYLPSAKFRRVRSDIWHSAKIWELGKVPVFCSGCTCSL
jgi:hypothetical protein